MSITFGIMGKLRGMICQHYYHKRGTGNTGAAVNLTTSMANSDFLLRRTPEILVGFFGADFFLEFFALTTLPVPPLVSRRKHAHMNKLYAVLGECRWVI
jgi:hypothetical protein